MTRTYPIPPADFASVLLYAQVKMWLDWMQDVSGDGRGRRYTADMSAPVWKGEITLAESLTHAQAARVQAIIEALDGARGSFYLCDPRLEFPIADAYGTVILAHEDPITITDIAGDNKRIKLGGCPPHYQLSTGDRLAFDFGSDPVHRAYHRIVDDVSSNGDGDTGWVEIRPYLFDGAVDTGTEVTLARPAAQWIIPPQGFSAGSGRRMLTPGGSFKIEQVI